jgi:murein L,D-transpeptidase YcbB/YkuD
MSQEGWPGWLAANREVMLAARTQYEWTFANLILSRVSGLDPRLVAVQQAFKDLEGDDRRMDFSVVENNVRVAIEVDGYNKVPGTTTGMTSDQFSEFLRRQNALSAQGWMVLRFANSDFTKNPGRCIRQIELALQQARSSAGTAPALSVSDAAELQRLREDSNDLESLKELLRKAEANRKRAEARARKARELAKKADSQRVEAVTSAQTAQGLRAQAEAQARRDQIGRQRAEEVAQKAVKRRRWLLAGISTAVLAASTTGVLYATRERLPGVAPSGRTTCPTDHPIKGNRSSSRSTKIYHVPSGAFYDRTSPVRCFATEDEAVSAGYRRSAR